MSKKFKDMTEIMNHVDNCNEAMEENGSVNDVNDNFGCPYCDKNFDTEDNVLLHLDMH